MRIYIIIGIILVFFFLGIVFVYQFTRRSTTTNQFNVNQDINILEVQLKRTAPFSSATIQISKQGNIHYEAEAPKTGINHHVESSSITESQFNELSDLIFENKFWSFDEQYRDVNLMDATTNTISVSSVSLKHPSEPVDAKVYSVSCYGSCPAEILEIINKIEELWGKEILQVGM